LQVAEDPVAVVGAAVVDEEDLGGAVEMVDHRPDPLVERLEAVGLVADGDDDGVRDVGHRWEPFVGRGGDHRLQVTG
jgi:hypothetical protein